MEDEFLHKGTGGNIEGIVVSQRPGFKWRGKNPCFISDWQATELATRALGWRGKGEWGTGREGGGLVKKRYPPFHLSKRKGQRMKQTFERYVAEKKKWGEMSSCSKE